MKKNKFFMVRMTAILLTFGVALTACSKTEAQAGGGKASKSAGKENPATDFRYDLTADGQGIVITAYTGSGSTVVVPAKIEDIPVVEIGKEVFDGKTTTIGLNSLGGGGLNNMNIQSKENAQAGITSITLPNTVTKIGSRAFANTAITKFMMPDSVTEIDDNIFRGCKQLAEVHLSDSIEMILGALCIDGNIQKINLPKNIKRIANFAFAGLGELTELVIPDSLTSVEFGDWNEYDKKWAKVGSKDGWGEAVKTNAFSSCGKLPLKTRQQLKDMGYTGNF